MNEIIDFFIIHERILWWIGTFSILSIFITLGTASFFIIQIPSDYFLHYKRRRLPWADKHPVVRAILLMAKNILGIIAVFIGLILLFLPGQGILTLLIGVMLLDFPGKYRFERILVERPTVVKSINWLRQRAGRDPVIVDNLKRCPVVSVESG